jgi:hypothetical protein
MTNPYVLATLLFYMVSLGLYIWNLREPSRTAGIGATACLIGGLFLHYLALLHRSRLIHAVPYDDLFGSLSLFAWLLAATYLGLEAIHRRRSVGPFVLPIVLIVFLLAHASPAGPIKAPPAQGPLFAFHVTLNILAYSAFAISFVLSVIYLAQNRRLRGHKLGIVGWRFPPLDVLERMARLDSCHLPRLHAVGKDCGVAGRARFGALYLKFHVRDFQLQYCESVSFALPPLLLSGRERRDPAQSGGHFLNGNCSHRTESPHGYGRAARARRVQRRTGLRSR